jgi:predicted permease
MFNNIRLAFRSLRQSPGLSLVVVVMLALGIGATTALFSLFHQILVQPLPVPNPERLVNLSTPGPKWGSTSCGLSGGCDYVFSYPMFRDLEAQQSAFAGLAGFRGFSANLSYGEQTLAGSGILVSGSYFSVLNLQPALGRLIGPRDEPKLNESAVIVLSHDYWQNRFGGDPDIVNKTLSVNGEQLTIIGVAPAGFSGTIIGARPEVFVPLTLGWRVRPTASRNEEDRRAYWLYVFARLKPNVSVGQTTAAINGLYGGILKEFDAPLNRNMPDDVRQQFLNQQIALQSGARGYSTIPKTTGQALTLLLGLTALVLLIVCVNIANLLLARGASRAGEMAIRASIGASRRQLILQLLTESILLAVIGGIFSLPVAATTLDTIIAMLPAQTSNQMTIQLSPAAMGFAAGVSLLTVLFFGLFPAIHATRSNPALVMKEQAPQSSGGGRGIVRFRAALVTAQIALCLVLLVLAGLFTKSLMNVARVNLGMQLDSVISFTVSPRSNGYSPERTRVLFDRIEEALATEPGVAGVTSASVPLITGSSTGNSITIEGFEPGRDVDTTVRRNEVSPSFFKTLSIPLLAGRYFTDADAVSAPKVAIVNQSLVRKFNLGSGAIGKHFSGYPYDNVTKVELEIVGVVADAAYSQVKGDTQPQYFQPRRQSERPGGLAFYVRSGIDPDALMRAIPGVVARIDRNLPVSNLITMRRQIQDNVYLDRLVAMLSAGFAGLATLLAAIGLYGVMAYNVTQRTREFGLRLALGAEPSRLRAMVLRQVGLMGLIGGVMGLLAAVTLGRAAEVLLFGLTGHDVRVLAAAATVLSVVVLVAGYSPARRASTISPMEALRYE